MSRELDKLKSIPWKTASQYDAYVNAMNHAQNVNNVLQRRREKQHRCENIKQKNDETIHRCRDEEVNIRKAQSSTKLRHIISSIGGRPPQTAQARVQLRSGGGVTSWQPATVPHGAQDPKRPLTSMMVLPVDVQDEGSFAGRRSVNGALPSSPTSRPSSNGLGAVVETSLATLFTSDDKTRQAKQLLEGIHAEWEELFVDESTSCMNSASTPSLAIETSVKSSPMKSRTASRSVAVFLGSSRPNCFQAIRKLECERRAKIARMHAESVAALKSNFIVVLGALRQAERALVNHMKVVLEQEAAHRCAVDKRESKMFMQCLAQESSEAAYIQSVLEKRAKAREREDAVHADRDRELKIVDNLAGSAFESRKRPPLPTDDEPCDNTKEAFSPQRRGRTFSIANPSALSVSTSSAFARRRSTLNSEVSLDFASHEGSFRSSPSPTKCSSPTVDCSSPLKMLNKLAAANNTRGGLSAKQTATLNHRWTTESEKFADRLRQELLDSACRPNHEAVYDAQMHERARQARKKAAAAARLNRAAQMRTDMSAVMSGAFACGVDNSAQFQPVWSAFLDPTLEEPALSRGGYEASGTHDLAMENTLLHTAFFQAEDDANNAGQEDSSPSRLKGATVSFAAFDDVDELQASGNFKRRTEFYKLKNAAANIVVANRLSRSQTFDFSMSATLQQALEQSCSILPEETLRRGVENCRQSRNNLAQLLIAGGMGRRNVEETRKRRTGSAQSPSTGTTPDPSPKFVFQHCNDLGDWSLREDAVIEGVEKPPEAQQPTSHVKFLSEDLLSSQNRTESTGFVASRPNPSTEVVAVDGDSDDEESEEWFLSSADIPTAM